MRNIATAPEPLQRFYRLSPRVVGVIVVAIALFLAGLGSALAFTGGDTYTVNVRQGAVLPLSPGRSLLVIQGPAIEQTIKTNLENTQSSVKLRSVKIHYTTLGIQVSADADVKVAAFTIPVPFKTTVHPMTTDGGGLQVKLSNTSAIGQRLPNVVQSVVESEVNRSIRSALPNNTYQLQDIELSPNGMLIYLTLNMTPGA